MPLPDEAGPFLALIAESPEELQSWLVFADWLDEHELPGHAAAARWLAAGNRPFPNGGDPPTMWTWFAWSAERVAYWTERGYSIDGLLPESPTVEPAGDRVRSGYGGWWDYPTRQAAELALMEAWPKSCQSADPPTSSKE